MNFQTLCFALTLTVVTISCSSSDDRNTSTRKSDRQLRAPDASDTVVKEEDVEYFESDLTLAIYAKPIDDQTSPFDPIWTKRSWSISAFSRFITRTPSPAPIALPPATDWIVCADCYPYTDDYLKALAKEINAKQIKQLTLSNLSIKDRQLAYFRNCKELELLVLRCKNLSRAGLQHLKQLRQVKSLTLGGINHQLGDDLFAGVSGLTSLETLAIGGGYQVFSGDVLRHLANLSNLRILSIRGLEDVADEHLQPLRNLTKLESLTIDGLKLNGNGLQHLENMSSLRHLTFRGEIRDESLKHIAQLKSLETVDIPVASDNGLAHLSGLSNLRSLSLVWRCWNITDVGMSHLRDLQLEELIIGGGDSFTGSGFSHLEKMTTLKRLVIGGNDAVNKIVRYGEKRKDPCPTDDGLASLAALTGLESLQFTSGCEGVRGEFLKHLVHLENLKTLDLRGTSVTNESLANLRRFNSLKTLDLRRYGLNLDGGAHHIAEIPKLENLALHVSGRGLEKLTKLRSLKSLVARGGITDDGLRHIVALKNLRGLRTCFEIA
jgi:hypothetical protein